MDAPKRAENIKLNTKATKEKELDVMGVPIPVIKQMENSERELISYTEEGSQLVTNVLLANDNRENNRRDTDNRERNIRLKAVEHEAEIANAKFTEISRQWPIILKKNDALEIHEHSELQKKRGFDLIEQKNKMIEILKRDLAESDSRFLDKQAAQSEDVRILQERIENQIKFIKKQYKNQIQYIKTTIDEQREFRMNVANEAWTNLYNETLSIETNSLDYRLAMIDKKENNIMKQYEMNEETLRSLKSNMNAELRHMQREFELIKTKCIENVEKLNYNFQVLKRREEENAYAKAVQRRQINKLQDILSTKRKTLRETKTKCNAKVPLLQNEIEKLKQDVERHDEKSERFAEIREKTYKELWNFSQEQINNNLEKIYKIDRIIYETHLGVDWQPPQRLKYPDISYLPSYRKKLNSPSAESTSAVECDGNAVSAAANAYAECRERALSRLVFDAIVDNAPSILDNELIAIVKAHRDSRLTLLYNVMAAYGLNGPDSWQRLLSYTRTMASCAICRGPVLWRERRSDRPAIVDSSRGEWKTEVDEQPPPLIDRLATFADVHAKRIAECAPATATSGETGRPTVLRRKPSAQPLDAVTDVAETRERRSFERTNTDDSDDSTITFSLSLTDFEQLCSENDSNPAVKSQRTLSRVDVPAEDSCTESEEQNDVAETAGLEFNRYQKSKESSNSSRNGSVAGGGQPCDNPNHPLMIDDADYLRVIKQTIDTSKSKTSDDRARYKSSDFRLTDTLAVNDVSDYWAQFLHAFPEHRAKLWDLFDKAVKKYYQTLHLRSKKAKDVEQLESENAELKTILKRFMDAEQNDARLQNMCAPKIRKQRNAAGPSGTGPTKPTTFADHSANVRGTSVHIFAVDRPNKKIDKRTIGDRPGPRRNDGYA